MGIVAELKDEWQALSNARHPWEQYWRNIAIYVLPQHDTFDHLLHTSTSGAINAVVSTPIAAEKSKDLYDMTSLWGIERLTAGMISLKTPETEMWQDLGTDSMFGEEPTRDEKEALERLRNYQFKVRHNPASGFWGAHKAAVRSMCAFGDGWMFVEENAGNARVPFRYEWRPLNELYPAVSSAGVPNRMFSVMRWSALQLANKFGDKIGAKVMGFANDPKKRHETFRLMHAVKPRDDVERNRPGVMGGAFQSHYCLPDEEIHLGESGYFEFPFVRYAWSNTGNRPFSEGPIAYALGEIKSLNEMAKNELLSTQMVLRPPIATHGKNFTRLNFNAGANNPGLITPDGKPLFAPMNVGVRPDFAQAVLESRRTSVREMVYLNLWQIVLQDKNDTATAAMIKAQEKGELLGPVGISLNEGLSALNDREIGILNRKGAFNEGSPLAMPDSMDKKNVAPIFRSPLDRLRRMGELVGVQRLIEIATTLEQIKPGTVARLDEDNILDIAQEILGAPIKVLRDAEQAKADRAQAAQAQQLMMAAETAKGGGEAAKAIGEGGTAMAQGAEVASQAPALQRLLNRAPEMMGQAA